MWFIFNYTYAVQISLESAINKKIMSSKGVDPLLEGQQAIWKGNWWIK